MIFWACAALTLGAAAAATFLSEIRRSVLALWLAGLGVGGLYLSMGAELLAIAQWILSTLTAISFIFYAVMFGEFGVADSRPLPKKLLSALMPVALGLCFVAMIWIGASELPSFLSSAPTGPGPVQGTDLLGIGKALASEHLLALQILGLTLFIVIVGSGVVARPEVLDR